MEEVIAKLTKIENLMRISQKDALDINECAIYLGISTSHLRHLACTHQIPHYKRLGRLYFSKKEMDDWRLSDRIPTDEEIAEIAKQLY